MNKLDPKSWLSGRCINLNLRNNNCAIFLTEAKRSERKSQKSPPLSFSLLAQELAEQLDALPKLQSENASVRTSCPEFETVEDRWRAASSGSDVRRSWPFVSWQRSVFQAATFGCRKMSSQGAALQLRNSEHSESCIALPRSA